MSKKVKKNAFVRADELNKEQNMFFVRGSNIGSRKKVAKRLAEIIGFPGGYRAAYRAVKAGYYSCGLYAGKLENGQYGLNAHYE